MAVCLAVEGRVQGRTRYDLVEAEPHDLAEVVRAFRGWLGYAPAVVLAVPHVEGDGAPPSSIRLRALSLGAGVQSTTMALTAAHGEIGPMPDPYGPYRQ